MQIDSQFVFTQIERHVISVCLEIFLFLSIIPYALSQYWLERGLLELQTKQPCL
jgi:hypothetical protein